MHIGSYSVMLHTNMFAVFKANSKGMTMVVKIRRKKKRTRKKRRKRKRKRKKKREKKWGWSWTRSNKKEMRAYFISEGSSKFRRGWYKIERVVKISSRMILKRQFLVDAALMIRLMKVLCRLHGTLTVKLFLYHNILITLTEERI